MSQESQGARIKRACAARQRRIACVECTEQALFYKAAQLHSNWSQRVSCIRPNPDSMYKVVASNLSIGGVPIG